MEETLKPMRKAAMMRTKSVFDDFREQAEDGSGGQSCPSSMPTPNRLANMVNKSTDALPSQARSFMDIPTFENPFVYNGMSAPLGMPQYASVDAGRVGLTAHQEMFMARPNFQVPPAPGGGDPSVHPESGRSSPMRGFLHRRSDSIASNMSAASIDSLNVDDARIETGIDLSEIETFIKGPDPTDGKWTCSFEDCDKRFGRKENIKSHVQTHLNDRQYQCPSCKKCFVRQHDLKRHAKIHTGIKPYMCDCGNSFARHDALTRHRQRGMCVGAFDGIVKKTVKRGRPRKNRPDGKDERGEKKAVHRKKTMSISSMSDLSACSDASDAASSPGSTTGFDRFRVDDLGMELDEEEAPRSENNVSAMLAGVMGQMPSQNHSFGDANAGPSNMVGQQQQEQQEHQHQQHQQHQQQQHPQHQQQQQHPQQHAYLVSDAVMAPMPIAHPRDASSRVVQAHRAASHAAPSPAKSSASHYNTPPDLSASRSSSPPLPPSGGSARLGDMSHSAGHQGGVMLRGYSTAEMQGGVSLTASDEDPNLYLIPKLEPDFDTNDFSMFSAGEAYHNPAETYAANEMYFGPT
jgi:regulatory protein SWI5